MSAEQGIRLQNLTAQERKTVAFFARTPHPDTRKPRTPEQLQDIAMAFGIPSFAVEDIEHIDYVSERVKPHELPDNEKAFYLGFALAGFQAFPTNWKLSERQFVVLGTRDKDTGVHRQLDTTIGTRGYIDDHPSIHKIYLPAPDYDFLLEPAKHANRDFLDARKRAAPFLMGLMYAHLKDGNNRIPIQPVKYAEMVKALCERNIGVSLGKFHRRKGVVQDTGTIIMDNPETVLAQLMMIKEVQTLPFFRQLFDGHDSDTREAKVAKIGEEVNIFVKKMEPVEVYRRLKNGD